MAHMDELVIRDFRPITGGVTYRKMGPWYQSSIDRTLWRWDALVIIDGWGVEQFCIQSSGEPFTVSSLRELKKSAWTAFHARHKRHSVPHCHSPVNP